MYEYSCTIQPHKVLNHPQAKCRLVHKQVLRNSGDPTCAMSHVWYLRRNLSHIPFTIGHVRANINLTIYTSPEKRKCKQIGRSARRSVKYKRELLIFLTLMKSQDLVWDWDESRDLFIASLDLGSLSLVSVSRLWFCDYECSNDMTN